MEKITLDVWLYGELREFGKEYKEKSFANLPVELPLDATVTDLLNYLEMPTEARGISFINGDLSAMPGLQPDLKHKLKDGDRVAFFDHHSMWPFQYRHGAAMIEEMSEAFENRDDLGMSHSYDNEE